MYFIIVWADIGFKIDFEIVLRLTEGELRQEEGEEEAAAKEKAWNWNWIASLEAMLVRNCGSITDLITRRGEE